MVIQSIDALCRVSGWDGRTDGRMPSRWFKNVLISVLILVRQRQSSTLFTAALQSHEYYWLQRCILSILFEPWGSGMGVLLVYRDLGFNFHCDFKK